jgi:hypothetical protein
MKRRGFLRGCAACVALLSAFARAQGDWTEAVTVVGVAPGAERIAVRGLYDTRATRADWARVFEPETAAATVGPDGRFAIELPPWTATLDRPLAVVAYRDGAPYAVSVALPSDVASRSPSFPFTAAPQPVRARFRARNGEPLRDVRFAELFGPVAAAPTATPLRINGGGPRSPAPSAVGAPRPKAYVPVHVGRTDDEGFAVLRAEWAPLRRDRRGGALRPLLVAESAGFARMAVEFSGDDELWVVFEDEAAAASRRARADSVPTPDFTPTAEEAAAALARRDACAARIVGIVRDAEGLPVAGAVVRTAAADAVDDPLATLAAAGKRTIGPFATTDAFGRFVVPHAPTGEVRLSVVAPSGEFGPAMSEPFAVGATGDAAAPAIRLPRAATLSVEGCSGELTLLGEGPPIAVATLDGRATIRGLAGGRGRVRVATSAGCLQFGPLVAELRPGETTRIDFGAAERR